jgi:DNA repair protein RadC
MTNTLTELKVSYLPKKERGPKITSSYTAYEALKKVFNDKEIQLREEFIVLYLDRAHHIKGWHRVSIGGITGTVADPRLILALALKTASTSIIISHNHPSGNLKPSEADINLTGKIKSACAFLDINLLDHIIITDESYLSFADDGLL